MNSVEGAVPAPRPPVRMRKQVVALFASTVASRGVTLLAQGWAARCLGPANLGVSGAVQALAQQVTLLCGAGIDTVASRTITRDPARVLPLTRRIVRFRLAVSGAAAALWSLAVVLVVPAAQRGPWLLGAAIILLGAFSLSFAYQGLQRLPVFGWAGFVGALAGGLVAAAFLRPGATAGSDIAITLTATLGTAALALWLLPRIVDAAARSVQTPVSIQPILRQSWRYLVQSGLVFFYSQYQVPLIAWQLGAAPAGEFRVAFLMATGIELAFNSLSSLLLPRLVGWHAAGGDVLWRQQGRLALRFAAIGCVGAVVSILAAPFVVPILVGHKFGVAAAIFQCLVVGRVIALVGQVYMFGLAARERDAQFLLSTAAGCLTSVSLNALVIGHWGVVGVAVVSAVAESAVAVTSWGFNRADERRRRGRSANMDEMRDPV